MNSKQEIEIAFSPCPNDTFIFDALLHSKIDTGNYTFKPILEDVQTLNAWAKEGKYPVTKLSYAVYPKVANNYKILNAGSALGNGVGPLLLAKNDNHQAVESCTIAIPGEDTTAHLLFSLAYPEAKNKVFLRFDEIEDFVLQGRGLGVIIHENRFTYAEKGLHKIIDLGNYWEEKVQQPIPLGGIVVNRSFPEEVQKDIDELIKKSIEFANAHYRTQPSTYIKEHAQEMTEAVMLQHIGLYVNDYSLQLGENGKQAILKLIEVYQNLHGGMVTGDIFV